MCLGVVSVTSHVVPTPSSCSTLLVRSCNSGSVAHRPIDVLLTDLH